jgi:hypothetical protein
MAVLLDEEIIVIGASLERMIRCVVIAWRDE